MRTLPLAAQNKATEDTGAKGLATSHGGAAMSTAAAATRGDTLHAVSLAAAAAAAAAAVHFNATARFPDRTLPRAQARSTPRPAHQSAAADHSVTAPSGQDCHDAAAPSSPPLRSRKRKVTLTLGDKIATIRMYDSGAHTWRSLQAAFLKEVSLSAVRRTCEPQERARLLKRGRDGEPLGAARTRRSKFEQIDAALKTRFDGIESMGGADLPMTMAVLETRALDIAADLGIEGFLGSPGFIQRWAARHQLKSVKLWGQAGSAAAAVCQGEQRMSQIRAELATYDPEHIYNMDETGLQYRCLPSRTYIAAGRRRRARGSKAIKSKDRVTLVFACHLTGSHKLPVAIIGSAAVPQCFRPPRNRCRLPYFSQKSAWMDAVVYEKWFNTVFVPGVRARTRSPVILIVYNGGAYSALECNGVTICPLPHNVTSVHLPLDAGIIACLKRRYKTGLIFLVLQAFPEKRRRQELAAAAADTAVATPTMGDATDAPRPAATQAVGTREAILGTAGSLLVGLPGASQIGTIETGPFLLHCPPPHRLFKALPLQHLLFPR